MRQTAIVHDIFEDVWGADSASIVRVFQPFSNAPLRSCRRARVRAGKLEKDRQARCRDLPGHGLVADVSQWRRRRFAPAIPARLPIRPVRRNYAAPSSCRWRHTTTSFAIIIKYNNGLNGPNTGAMALRTMLANSGYGQGGGGSSPPFLCPQPAFMLYETAFSTAINPAVSLTDKTVRAGLTHDFTYHPAFYDTETTFLQAMSQPGPAGTPGFESGCITGLVNTRTAGFTSYNTSNGSDGGFVECWSTFIHQTQQAGLGTSNLFWAGDLGGTATGGGGSTDVAHDVDNVSVNAQAYYDWIMDSAVARLHGSTSATMALSRHADSFAAAAFGTVAAAMGATEQHDARVTIASGLAAPLIHVSPSRIQPDTIVARALVLEGVSTNWSSGSTVSITNSLTGTTTVTKGTFTAVSATSATLTYTTGVGTGTWQITIDGIDSPILGVGARRKGWFGSRLAPLRLGVG